MRKISLITINKLKLIDNANKYNPMVNNWIDVFSFAKKVTFVLSDKLFLAEYSLRAVTPISLAIINELNKDIS